MAYNSNAASINQDSLAQVLSDPAVQSALVTALEKLPQVMDQYSELENMVEFARNFSRDKQSVQSVVDGLRADLPELHVDRETIAALFTLVNKLPKFVELLTAVEPLLEFARQVLNDRESLTGLVRGAEDFVAPVKNGVTESMTLLEEAKQRAAKDNSTVNVFALLKLLRDPNVQYGVHFAQALLTLLQERQAAK